jgi:hypothetical protein
VLTEIFNSDVKRFNFVSKAIDKKHVKESFRYISVDKDFISGTDGKRLHLSRNIEERECGIYRIIEKSAKRLEAYVYPKDHKVTEGFPDYKKMAAKFGLNEESLRFDTTQFVSFYDYSEQACYAQIIRFSEKNTINFDYFKSSNPSRYDLFSWKQSHELLVMLDHKQENICLIMPVFIP